MDTKDTTNFLVTLAAPTPIFGPGSPVVSSFGTTAVTTTNQRASFLGVGPRLGVEGSVPLPGKWAFEYLGDAALLFGTERSSSTVTNSLTATPAVLNALFGGGSVTTTTARQYAGLFNGDLQFGISYWVSPNVKVTGSYRLDAFIHLFNESGAAAANLTPDRYIHGPRLAVTGQF
jgi:hypothetical protein